MIIYNNLFAICVKSYYKTIKQEFLNTFILLHIASEYQIISRKLLYINSNCKLLLYNFYNIYFCKELI